MQASPLTLMVCDTFRAEMEAVCRLSEWGSRVRLTYFEGDCDHPLASLECAAEGAMHHLIGGGCLSQVAPQVEDEGGLVTLLEPCFALLCGQTQLDHWLRKGAHLVTPGLLRQWPQAAARWGMSDPVQRHAYFAESGRCVVLLDTGVDEDVERHLTDFATYVGLPAERVPVGLEILKLHLEGMLHRHQQQQSDQQQRQIKKQLQQQQMELTNRAMTVDLLAQLTGFQREIEVIEGVFQLLEMLCAPSALHYVPLGRHLDALQPAYHR
ncbi:MAG: DUF1638 domain-containing protein, partial [Magnetococcales bacterium]|nr:DUF1638 domain-containing protein [Magnetococcales bacterium]